METGFNPRTRTGCDAYLEHLVSNARSFNPRTRTGCDQLREMHAARVIVSIHAPARGATGDL